MIVFILALLSYSEVDSVCIDVDGGNCPSSVKKVAKSFSEALTLIISKPQSLDIYISSTENSPLVIDYSKMPTTSVRFFGNNGLAYAVVSNFPTMTNIELRKIIMFLNDNKGFINPLSIHIEDSMFVDLNSNTIMLMTVFLQTDFQAIDSFSHITASQVKLFGMKYIPTESHNISSNSIMTLIIDSILTDTYIECGVECLSIVFTKTKARFMFFGVNSVKRSNDFTVSIFAPSVIHMIEGSQPLYETMVSFLVSGALVNFSSPNIDLTAHSQLKLYNGAVMNILGPFGPSEIIVHEKAKALATQAKTKSGVLYMEPGSELIYLGTGLQDSLNSFYRFNISDNSFIICEDQTVRIEVDFVTSRRISSYTSPTIKTFYPLCITNQIHLGELPIIIISLYFGPTFTGIRASVDKVRGDKLFPIFSVYTYYPEKPVKMIPYLHVDYIGNVDDAIIRDPSINIIYHCSPNIKLDKYETFFDPESPLEGFTNDTSIFMQTSSIVNEMQCITLNFTDLPGSFRPLICIDDNVDKQMSVCRSYARRINSSEVQNWTKFITPNLKTLTIAVQTHLDYTFDFTKVKDVDYLVIGGQQKPSRFRVLANEALMNLKKLVFQYSVVEFEGTSDQYVFKNKELQFIQRTEIKGMENMKFDFRKVEKLKADPGLFSVLPVDQSNISIIHDMKTTKIVYLNDGWELYNGNSLISKILHVPSKIFIIEFSAASPMVPKPIELVVDDNTSTIHELYSLSNRYFTTSSNWDRFKNPAIKAECPLNLELTMHSRFIPVSYISHNTPYRSVNITSYNENDTNLVIPFVLTPDGDDYYPIYHIGGFASSLTVNQMDCDQDGGTGSSIGMKILKLNVFDNVSFELTNVNIQNLEMKPQSRLNLIKSSLNQSNISMIGGFGLSFPIISSFNSILTPAKLEFNWNTTSIPEGFVSETYSNVFCGEPNSIIINQPTLVINKQKVFINVSKTKGCYDIYVSMIDIPPESRKSEKWKVYAAGSVSIIVLICTVLVCYCRKSYLSSNELSGLMSDSIHFDPINPSNASVPFLT